MSGGGHSGRGCLMQKTATMELHEKNSRPRPQILKVWCLVVTLLSCGFLTQCSDGDAIPLDSRGYFPLREGSSWQLLLRHYSGGPDGIIWDGGYDTVQYAISGDTIINGLTYKKLGWVGGGTFQFLRKQGFRYYARDVWFDGFSEEYLFLDEAAPVNTTWYLSSYLQYKVVAVNTMRTINGVTYNHVIEMQLSRPEGDGPPSLVANIYYAKGVGEIYGSFPAPLSATYADIEKILIKYTR